MKVNINKQYKIKAKPIANPRSIVKGELYRFTILTSKLIRIEYSKDGIFEDRATQAVLNRDYEVPDYKVIKNSDGIEIITKDIHLIYNKGEFTRSSLSIQVKGAFGGMWHFGEEPKDLGGTARTLDEVDGATSVGHGLLSKSGFSVIDDSKSLIITEDGWVESRKQDNIDMYFFGYGRDYLGCLKDFYHLCGSTPLIPRYALGNWWSRYYRYSEQDYKALIMRFEEENIPFSVAVVDMDWHLVDIDPKYGSGWTGYTWNKELFPEPEEFIAWLHERGLKVTLNVHPADGVRPHEEMYVEMAKALGVDYKSEESIRFDIANPEFLEACFKFLYHPNEKRGVDFWWIDWQQGATTKIPGLDPLWMLNHYHYLDSKRNGKRGMTFSRYAGIGSHRYPIGFSGDTVITWDSLDFQPYFTANASNVGYGWWSHDIGGHMLGYKDDELAVRWLQFGVFSPINRLHSSCSPFNGKEPWRYNLIAENVMKDYLRLRHKLVPYLYTMNYLCNKDGIPLIQPMYYHNTFEEAAYSVKNQYYYGSELIVCPITTRINNKINEAHVTAWLPKGLWFDFFTGRVYKGDRKINLYRGIEQIPVLAKAGAIVPMTGDSDIKNLVDNPKELEVRIFAGDNGNFTLYEDDGNSSEETNKGWAATKMTLNWNEETQAADFIIEKPQGYVETLPNKRQYNMRFVGFKTELKPEVFCNGEKIKGDFVLKEDKNAIIIKLPEIDIDTEIRVHFQNVCVKGNDLEHEVFDFLNDAQISFAIKEQIYATVRKNKAVVINELQAMDLEKELIEAVSEIIWAY